MAPRGENTPDNATTVSPEFDARSGSVGTARSGGHPPVRVETGLSVPSRTDTQRVIGRRRGHDGGPTAALGHYLARDGTRGSTVRLDLDGPHAACVVGKRGSGKSYTVGVLAEDAARTRGVAPVVVDPLGAFRGLSDGPSGTDPDSVPARVVDRPRVRADALPPRCWPRLVGLAPDTPAGAVLWQVAADHETLSGMRDGVHDADCDDAVRRVAANHLALASSWDVFSPDGLAPGHLTGGEATILDCSGLPDEAIGAVVSAAASGLYAARLSGDGDRLPWLFVDEAHVAFTGVAADAMTRLFTRGRAPGVSVVVATQRPAALPDVALSQSDLLVAHRLTARSDVDALAAAMPTYLDGTLRERLPTRPGACVVVDDVTESVHQVAVRERDTPHGGGSPRVSDTRRR